MVRYSAVDLDLAFQETVFNNSIQINVGCACVSISVNCKTGKNDLKIFFFGGRILTVFSLP